MSLSYICRILYDAGGHTGNIYYARFIRKRDGQIWDDANQEMAANPNWEDSAITLTETGTTGQFPVIVPADLPRENFDVIIYIQAGSAPQNTDNITLQFDASVGSIFNF